MITAPPPPKSDVEFANAEASAPSQRPAQSAPAFPSSHISFANHEDDEPGFFRKHRLATAIAVVALTGGFIWTAKKLSHSGSKSPRPPAFAVVQVQLPPPPPPPLPPPPPPQQPEEKMIEQLPVENEEKPEPKADDAPPPDLGTGIKGDGPPDGFGLSGSGRGNTLGNGNGSAGARSRWGWFASKVQSQIGAAIRSNRKTRSADLRVDVRVWPDDTGRITRAELAGSSGSAALDATIRDEILTGLRLSEAPPPDMPKPIVLRLTVRRPN
jgi:periplasmic protein TonB